MPYPEMNQLHSNSFLGQTLRTLKEENLHSGQSVRQYMWLCILLGRKNEQVCYYILIHGL